MKKSGLEYLQSRERRWLDIIGALMIGGVSAPLLPGLALAAAIDTRSAKPIFRQLRKGLDGEEFKVNKFRSMPERADDQHPTIIVGDNDSRSSKFGKFMRKSKFDELPQVANVLMGQMALVGIRPLLQEVHDSYKAADEILYFGWSSLVQATRPGLTNLSQLHRRGQPITPVILRHSMTMDMEWGDSASFNSDMATLGQTAQVLRPADKLLLAKSNNLEYVMHELADSAEAMTALDSGLLLSGMSDSTAE